MADAFIYETSNNRLQRFIALSIVLLLVATGITLTLGSLEVAGEGKVGSGFFASRVPDLVKEVNLAKQFTVSVMSGMIIFPIPNEIPFYMGLKQGNDPYLSVAATVIGFLIGNLVSYFLGLKLSKQVVYLLSTKNIYELRRKVNKYGIYAVFVANIVPMPSDVLTFGLGMVRYNFKRLFLALAVSNLLKFGVLAYIILHFA